MGVLEWLRDSIGKEKRRREMIMTVRLGEKE
jgi:hypothetical protein